jgi:rod shape determining protein RodA
VPPALKMEQMHKKDDSLYSNTSLFSRVIYKHAALSWFLIFCLLLLGGVGVCMMYSAAGGDMHPWGKAQLIRLVFGVCVLYAIAMSNIHYWYKGAWIVYGVGLLLLVAVPFIGKVGMGAQRWIDLGVMNIQPSEIMKIAIILLFARLYEARHRPEHLRFLHLLFYLILLAIPSMLVFKQPDLGTSLIIFMLGFVMLFVMGFRIRYFALLGCFGAAAVPFIGIKSYQLKRILNFLNPEHDPLGSGYQIMQSKIAFGAGGLSGKGFLQGTQNYLQFLPEKQTDFVLAMFAEEFGFYGTSLLIALVLTIIIYSFFLSIHIQHAFGRLLSIGVVVNFFLYFIINSFMVMGMLPVVGVPFPLLSYGGTTILTVMIGFGLLLNMFIHKDYNIKKHAYYFDYKQII